MNRTVRYTSGNLFPALPIASGYFFVNLPSYAEEIAQKKLQEPKLASTEPKNIKIAQAKTIQKVQLIGDTILSPEELAPIVQPLNDKAITPERVEICCRSTHSTVYQ